MSAAHPVVELTTPIEDVARMVKEGHVQCSLNL